MKNQKKLPSCLLPDYTETPVTPSGKKLLGEDSKMPAYHACHTGHKPLALGGGLSIEGGSCSNTVPDMDIYVGLDASMKKHKSSFPWVKGEAFLFPITDMQAPKDVDDFKNLITYLEQNIRAGKKVHVGCIGGHGRTGTVLSALVAQMMGDKDAIQYVRKNYCTKAVESKEQVDFLIKHYGVTSVAATKEYKADNYWGGTMTNYKKPSALSFAPMESNFCLWGANCKLIK